MNFQKKQLESQQNTSNGQWKDKKPQKHEKSYKNHTQQAKTATTTMSA